MTKRKILITGDTVIDHHIFKGNIAFSGVASGIGTQIIETKGGASLLHELVCRVCEAREHIDVQFHGESDSKNNAFAIWGPSPSYRKDDPDHKSDSDRKEKRWRVTEMLGYGSNSDTAPANDNKDLKDLSSSWDMVVFDDGALGYRGKRANWPGFILEESPTKPWVVVKMSHPVGQGELWAKLGSRGLYEKMILVVSADDLRRDEVMITSGRSWEQTVQNLLAEIELNYHLNYFKLCRHVIVHFRSEGALWIDNSDTDKRKYDFFFDPGCLEGDWDKGFSGRVLGSTTCFTAGIVCALLENLDSADSSPDFAKGISNGLCAMRTLLQEGYGIVNNKKPSFPFSGISKVLTDTGKSKFSNVVLPLSSVKNRGTWSFVEELSLKDKRPLYDKARQVALEGAAVLEKIPYGQFGVLYTVDRSELESLNGIRQLINHYVTHDKGEKPLSLGVFGPPGSGKSFGIKQIVKGILGKDTPILEFNLSQFDGQEMIFGGLHQVRDMVLKGKIPVVFWDEFDSGKLKWLQYLLAPMQDGAFLDGQISHPIGKCIFVFAGGTSSTMEAFSPPLPDENEADKNKLKTAKDDYKDFKNKKGPDFVSRLRGYLNVLGPNQRQRLNPKTGVSEPDPTDTCFPIRRALLLRVMSGMPGKGTLKIDSGLLNAFLKIKEYKHGARSLETIINLTLGGDKGRLMRSNLPPREQVSLHVDYDDFFDLIQQDLAFQNIGEDLAPYCHGFYLDTTDKKSIKYHMEYEKLPPDIKADNVAAARRIPRVLSLINMQVVKTKEDEIKRNDNIANAIENNLELLAEAEHNGWMDEKFRKGWRPTAQGEKRDDKQQIHDCLVPYSELSEENKDKDRNSVKNYPEIIDLAGYAIVYEE